VTDMIIPPREAIVRIVQTAQRRVLAAACPGPASRPGGQARTGKQAGEGR